MAEVTHLLHDCSASDIVAEIEVHGAVIVDDFVMPSWLAAFNASVQTSIEFFVGFWIGFGWVFGGFWWCVSFKNGAVV